MSDKCNSCGADIEFDAGSQSLKCQYCGAINEIQKEEDQLPDGVESIIPFTVSKDDLEKRVYEYMASGDYTPDDILEASTFTKQELFYVPAFMFRVEYEATWTASFGYDRTEHYTVYEDRHLGNDSRGNSRGYHQVPVTKTKTVTDWRPANGVDSGIFSVATYAGKKLGETKLNPATLVVPAIYLGSITDFNPSYMNGFESESFSVSEASAYASLKSERSSNIDREVKNHGQGDHQRDWNWNAKTSPSTITLYVPIYHAVFDYKGTEYNVWLDGIGTYASMVADKLPVDATRKNLVTTIRENLVPQIQNKVYLGLVPLGVGVAYLMTGAFTYDGLITAAILGGGYAAARSYFLIEYSDYLIKYSNNIIESSQNNRDSLLTQIHASSNTIEVIGDEERDKIAQSFQLTKGYGKNATPDMLSLREFIVNNQLVARIYEPRGK